jgi:hypothetical protein
MLRARQAMRLRCHRSVAPVQRYSAELRGRRHRGGRSVRRASGRRRCIGSGSASFGTGLFRGSSSGATYSPCGGCVGVTGEGCARCDHRVPGSSRSREWRAPHRSGRLGDTSRRRAQRGVGGGARPASRVREWSGLVTFADR